MIDMNNVKKSLGYYLGNTVREKSRGYSLNTKIFTIICKDTSVGRELLYCLMAGRPNESQSVGQSLICCLRAGGGSTFLQVFSTGRDNLYILDTRVNSHNC